MTDRTLRSQDDPIVLFPRAGGNLHQLTALTDCAIISLLCPPYSSNQGERLGGLVGLVGGWRRSWLAPRRERATPEPPKQP